MNVNFVILLCNQQYILNTLAYSEINALSIQLFILEKKIKYNNNNDIYIYL